jgi:hypothetical protein
VKGIGLCGASQVIAPVEDGSVALWSLDHLSDTRKEGAIQARSKPGLLFSIDAKDKGLSTVINSAVSVDSFQDKAYIAVQNYLQEIDLHTLSISNRQRFPWAIAALSDVSPGVPLTVGTRSTLHMYDPRLKHRSEGSDSTELLDLAANFPTPPSRSNDFSLLISGNVDPHTSFVQPSPTAIHHLFPHGAVPDAKIGEIIVAGRFPSLLIYDRRTFPKLQNTIHSGSQLCGLTSLPFAFQSMETDLMRQGQLSVRAAQEARSRRGDTLFACGEYQGKGSLEIYGLSADRSLEPGKAIGAGHSQISTYKNRVSASRSKLLSIATHGTKLIVSDGDGQIRWLERDGQTLIRRWNINKFGCIGDNLMSNYGPSTGDVVLKLLPISQNLQDVSTYEDRILLWTGERIGMMKFSSKPSFGGEDGKAWDMVTESEEVIMQKSKEDAHEETMREALERQANEVRWVRGLGLMG